MNKAIDSRSRSYGLVSAFIGVFLLFVWIAVGLAQESKVDLNAFIQETQKISKKPDEVTVIWWIPKDYWWVTLAQNPNVTAVMTEEFKKVFSSHIVLIVVDGKTGPFGAITYTPETAIRANIQIRDSEGVRYRPLNEDTNSRDSKNFLLMLRPVLANILGQMEQNIHFFLFPAENKGGQNIVEPQKERSFSVELGEREFRWRLPLQTLPMPKVCPTCGEK